MYICIAGANLIRQEASLIVWQNGGVTALIPECILE